MMQKTKQQLQKDEQQDLMKNMDLQEYRTLQGLKRCKD